MSVTEVLGFVVLGILGTMLALVEVVRLVFLAFAASGVAKGKIKTHRESIRTSFFTLTVIVVAGLAAFTLYKGTQLNEPDVNARVGKPLFAAFRPIDAKRLEIVKYDAEKNRFDDFSVEQQGTDIWRIPSHQNYPADALEQVSNAASSLLNVKVLDVVPDAEIDQELFGVIEPDPESVKVGQEGVGTMVTLRDKNNTELARMIVGKARRGKPTERFVRIPGQQPVYIVEYDETVLKTDFRDWIEKDLLQLDAINIQRVSMSDYQVDPSRFLQGGRVTLTRYFDATVRSDFNVWALESMTTYEDRKTPEPRVLESAEQLNYVRLDEMKAALDNLSIVDVERKPQGLSADLTSGAGFNSDQESVLSLALKGFGFVGREKGARMISSNGEMIVQTVNGIEYILRFGNIQGSEEGSGGKLNRYLMVTTRVNEDAFPLPTREVVPTNSGTNDNGPPKLDLDDGGDTTGDDKSGDDKSSDDQSSDTSSGDDQAAGAGSDDQVEFVSLQQDDKEKERIEREYQIRVKEREARIEQASKQSRVLNARFADWYYVISEDDYQALKVKQSEMIMEQPR